MVIKPAGYAIWENIQKELDARFKETGVPERIHAIIHSRELTGEGERPRRGLCPRGSMGNSWWIRRAAGASVRKTDLRDSVL